jgi:hypothetical protein
MSIQVTCPNGHELRVKDKYAGKTGQCPHCRSEVSVPYQLTDEHVLGMVGEYFPPAEPKEDSEAADDDDDVLDDAHALPANSSGVSLLGPSLVKHKKGSIPVYNG